MDFTHQEFVSKIIAHFISDFHFNIKTPTFLCTEHCRCCNRIIEKWSYLPRCKCTVIMFTNNNANNSSLKIPLDARVEKRRLFVVAYSFAYFLPLFTYPFTSRPFSGGVSCYTIENLNLNNFSYHSFIQKQRMKPWVNVNQTIYKLNMILSID